MTPTNPAPACASLLRDPATGATFPCGAPATLTSWTGRPLCGSCRAKANATVDAAPAALRAKALPLTTAAGDGAPVEIVTREEQAA